MEAAHFVCCGKVEIGGGWGTVPPSFLLPQPAQAFWKANSLDPCDRAVIALDGGKLRGFFRYYWLDDGIFAAGTWVGHHARGKGVALRMWRKALELEQPKRVEVTAVSPGGEGLVARVVALYPNVLFDLNAP